MPFRSGTYSIIVSETIHKRLMRIRQHPDTPEELKKSWTKLIGAFLEEQEKAFNLPPIPEPEKLPIQRGMVQYKHQMEELTKQRAQTNKFMQEQVKRNNSNTQEQQ